MMFPHPDDLFDREIEWGQLADFATAPGSGLRIGVVHGRRRQGKSFLLRRLARSADGLYHQAQELERLQALARFAGDVADRLGLPREQLRFDDWETAFRTALGYPQRGDSQQRMTAPSGPVRMLVLDELPYLLNHSPEIPSVLQEIYDESRDATYAPAIVIVCGSALSVMADLLSGTKPLRGRAELDLVLRPFDYRLAARYWGISDPTLALTVHTIFGGTAGYKSLVRTPVPTDEQDLLEWLGANVLNPAHALYGEKDYLLREDTRIADKQLYNSVLSAVAAGNHSPTNIASVLGRASTNLAHPLKILVETGFLHKVEDVLSQRRPLYFLADPIIRFAEVVVEPNRPLLEESEPLLAWRRAAHSYSSLILGPHFEQMARTWTRRFSGERWGAPLGEVGPATINDPAGRSQHELDVVALAAGERRGRSGSKVLVLGEAKATEARRDAGDLTRLERIRDLLAKRGTDVTDAQFALFGRTGFTQELRAVATSRTDVHLISLHDMYELA